MLLGDELDSPRGRIYLIKEMLEQNRPATRDVVKHIDRCLSCLACMTTCPSGVNYMHLVDHGREHIEKTYKRPFADRLLRAVLARVLTDASLFRLAVVGGIVARPFAPMLRALGMRRLAAMIALTPHRKPAPPTERTGKVYAAHGRRRGRVALLSGCINPVLSPSTDEAAIRVLTRHGIEVVVAEGEGCCGSLVAPHGPRGRGACLGAQRHRRLDARDRRRRPRRHPHHGLRLWNHAEGLRFHAAHRPGLCRQGGEGFEPGQGRQRISRHARAQADATGAASPSPITPPARLQHGQNVTVAPKELLGKCGFVVKDVPEGHLCCGSAGTYNILQPALAERLRERKVANIERLAPDVIAAGNIGCLTQIASGTAIPVVHTVELIDWATGGPLPEPLRQAGRRRGGVGGGDRLGMPRAVARRVMEVRLNRSGGSIMAKKRKKSKTKKSKAKRAAPARKKKALKAKKAMKKKSAAKKNKAKRAAPKAAPTKAMPAPAPLPPPAEPSPSPFGGAFGGLFGSKPGEGQ